MPNVKGSLLLHTVKALRRYRNSAEKVIAPALRPYLNDLILHSSWYPETDHLELLRTLVAITPEFNGDAWERYGERMARRDLTELYRILVTREDPTRTLEKLGSLWSLYHDTGRFEVQVTSPGQAELDLVGYEVIAPELCRNNAAYVAEMLRVAGARGVTVEKVLCRATGDGRCRWRAAWIDPEGELDPFATPSRLPTRGNGSG